jgi:transposase
VLPWRWVIERTFAWFGHFRRLSKDYEKSVKSAEAFLWIAGAVILLNRLGKAL